MIRRIECTDTSAGFNLITERRYVDHSPERNLAVAMIQLAMQDAQDKTPGGSVSGPALNARRWLRSRRASLWFAWLGVDQETALDRLEQQWRTGRMPESLPPRTCHACGATKPAACFAGRGRYRDRACRNCRAREVAP